MQDNKYQMKLKLNDFQYLAVLNDALVIVTVDRDGKPIRHVIFKKDKQTNT